MSEKRETKVHYKPSIKNPKLLFFSPPRKAFETVTRSDSLYEPENFEGANDEILSVLIIFPAFLHFWPLHHHTNLHNGTRCLKRIQTLLQIIEKCAVTAVFFKENYNCLKRMEASQLVLQNNKLYHNMF